MSTMILTETAYEASNDFTLVLNTNRITGVNPLGISFDVVDTVFPDDDTIMLAEFMWDFGDNGTANGTGTDDEYNIGKGYAVAHVYREVGTYTATVTAYYKEMVKTASVEITATAFSGTTYYVSAEGSDDNDGLTESTAFLTPKYAIETYIDPSTRFLLRQGDTFTKTDQIIVGAYDDVIHYGPVIIGSYEDSSSPSDAKPIVYDSRVNDGYTSHLAFLNCEDFRVMNIYFLGAGETQGLRDESDLFPSGLTMSSNAPCENCLYLDCDVYGAGTSYKPEGTSIIAQDFTIENSGSYGVFMTSGESCAFIGLDAKDFSNITLEYAEYTMRLSHLVVKNYIAHCDLRADYTNNDFQIRGDGSSYNYVWNNQFDRFAGMNQTNNEEDETLHHNTFDSNIIVARDYSGNLEDSTSSGDGRGFFFSSNKSMVRNNIVYGFDNSFYLNTHDIVGGCKTIWYHNNTAITGKENTNFLGANKDATGIHMRNNIFYNYATTSSYSDRYINIVTEYQTLPTYLSQIDSDYNTFIGDGWDVATSQTLVGVAYDDDDPNLSEWQDDYSNDVNSNYADALLNVTMDMDDVDSSLDAGFATLGDGSPAIGTGTKRMWTRFDFNGDERATNDMGAICTEVK